MRLTIKNKYRAYTLIEMLIALAIFSTLIAIGSSSLMLNYSTGHSQSMQKSQVNRDVLMLSGALRQYAENANAYDVSTGVYGISVPNQNFIIFASTGTSTPPTNTCTSIGLEPTSKTIWMIQESCSQQSNRSQVDTSPGKFQQLTSNNTQFTNFSFVAIPYSGASLGSPILNVSFIATDVKTKNQMHFNDTYTIAYSTYLASISSTYTASSAWSGEAIGCIPNPFLGEPPIGGTAASATNITQASTLDSVFWDTSDLDQKGDCPMHMYRFTVTNPTITSYFAQAVGYGKSATDDTYNNYLLFIWNFSSSRWEKLGNVYTGSTECNKNSNCPMGNITQNLSNYKNASNYVYLETIGPTESTEGMTPPYGYLRDDFVYLTASSR